VHHQADRLKGAEFARRALEVAGDDPDVLANAAQALAYVGEDMGTMMALVDRALALNPSFARGWHISGNISLMAGEPDTATEAPTRAASRAAATTAQAVRATAGDCAAKPALRTLKANPKGRDCRGINGK
jgi:adenylate cyclase